MTSRSSMLKCFDPLSSSFSQVNRVELWVYNTSTTEDWTNKVDVFGKFTELWILLYRQMSPHCTFNTGGLWQRQPRLQVLFRLVLQDLLHSQPSDWLSLTEKHSILWFLIQKFLNRVQVYFMLPTPESIPVMAGNYCVSAPRGRKSRMRNAWDCSFKSLKAKNSRDAY